jgi:hypothetical protein
MRAGPLRRRSEKLTDRRSASVRAAHRDTTHQPDTKLDTTSPHRLHVSARARRRRHELGASHTSSLPRCNLPLRGTGNAPPTSPKRGSSGVRGLSGPPRCVRKPDPRARAGHRSRNNRWRFKPGSLGARHDLSTLALRDAPRTRQRSGLDRSSQLACPNPQEFFKRSDGASVPLGLSLSGQRYRAKLRGSSEARSASASARSWPARELVPPRRRTSAVQNG